MPDSLTTSELTELWTFLTEAERAELSRLLAGPKTSQWTDDGAVYVNAETGKRYQPHTEAEREFVFGAGGWRHGLVKGGEGSGKSVAGIIKDLERLRKGMSGAMVSPDLEHFKRSLWPEFRRWCPWDQVVYRQRYRGAKEWEPSRPFTLTFINGAVLFCGGAETPEKWEGPNLHFVHGDEVRQYRTPAIIKVMDGRIRLEGPTGEPPQAWWTTTPRKHWLYDYFGPPKDEDDGDDPHASFKAQAKVVTLLTRDNAANLAAGYEAQRRASLTEAEARVVMDAEWEDIDDAERFLPSMVLWDRCKEALPPLDAHTPLVLAVDAGVKNDGFGVLAMSRHPDDARRDTDVAVRWKRYWKPKQGRPLDFDDIEKEIRDFCGAFRVVVIVYDTYQLHQMMTRLNNSGVAWTVPFSQGGDRLVADKALQSLILEGRLAHDGDPELRQQVDNANAKMDADHRKLRLVKRSDDQKIDLVVCASMAAKRCLDLNL